ncbi:MAG: type II toxin-antitoxin system RelB/DinJ family antitoxin [Clostridiales bacterium]|nr:type II toxin-antitoxin system RelB/DinJ family antitoxin [Clostridiales bacterium]
MANKTANFNLRMDPEVKKNAEELFSSFGMTMADAVNIFIYKSLLVGGLPFDVRYPEDGMPSKRKAKKTVENTDVKQTQTAPAAKPEPSEDVKQPEAASNVRRSSVQDLFKHM